MFNVDELVRLRNALDRADSDIHTEIALLDGETPEMRDMEAAELQAESLQYERLRHKIAQLLENHG